MSPATEAAIQGMAQNISLLTIGVTIYAVFRVIDAYLENN